jgi:nucleotide-binding universal stress UspA family protein
MDSVMTVRSILSAVDFSEQSRHALRWAGTFAAKFRSRLTVISVVDPLLAEATKIRLRLDLATTDTEPALREFVAATWPSGAPAAQVVLKTPVGEAATAILGTVSAEGVELIVAGTQGLGGIRKWLLGSTTERLLRRTHVPVLAVPPDRSESHRSNADGTIEVNRILMANDFSESSLVAAKYAAQLACHVSAKLILAHVVEPLIVPAPWRSLAQESDETRAADARIRLKSLAERLCPEHSCDTVAAVGRAADVIGTLAEEHRAQLIVMGLTSAEGAFAPRPGSIAYRVLTSTVVPVLVVPAAAGEGALQAHSPSPARA